MNSYSNVLQLTLSAVASREGETKAQKGSWGCYVAERRCEAKISLRLTAEAWAN